MGCMWEDRGEGLRLRLCPSLLLRACCAAQEWNTPDPFPLRGLATFITDAGGALWCWAGLLSQCLLCLYFPELLEHGFPV